MAICKPVLVVEDDKDLLENLIELLESEGYEVMGAANGQLALDRLLPLAPDRLPGCILLDLMMPVMDGKSFLKIVSQEYPDTLAKIPIVVATANGSSGRELADIPLSVQQVRKPFELDEFLGIIAGHCHA